MIYLDQAATTFPKPACVYRAADRAARESCGNPGRGSHRASRSAGAWIDKGREAVASLFGGRPEHVVFTLNATYALNLAISALAKPRETVLISSMEHNAVFRPVVALGGEYEVFSAIGSRDEVMADFRRHLLSPPSLVVCNHVSNLCGLTLPVEEMGALCRARGIPLIIDASQSAGHRALDLEGSGAAVICAPGHKGLFGLQGSGFALFSEAYAEHAERLRLFLSGGNGVASLEPTMPTFLPERFEVGTLPTPAIASLAAGIGEVQRIGLTAIAEKEAFLGKRLLEGLSVIRGMRVYGAEYGGGTVLFHADGITSERLCEWLDERGFCLRGGFHCCPLGHKTLGTPSDGAVRASFSYRNSVREVDALLHALSFLPREGIGR